MTVTDGEFATGANTARAERKKQGRPEHVRTQVHLIRKVDVALI